MSRERPGWAMLVVMLPIMMVNLIPVVRHRADVAAMWPVWRPMVLDLLLVIAGALLVTAVAAGIHAWRAARRVDHA